MLSKLYIYIYTYPKNKTCRKGKRGGKKLSSEKATSNNQSFLGCTVKCITELIKFTGAIYNIYFWGRAIPAPFFRIIEMLFARALLYKDIAKVLYLMSNPIDCLVKKGGDEYEKRESSTFKRERDTFFMLALFPDAGIS